MDNYSDIIKACLKLDQAAQKKFYQMFSDKMYGVCLRYVNDSDEAKDILQDGFIKVFANLHKYKFIGSLEGWIRRIVVNTALERFRDKNYLFSVNMESGYEAGEKEYDHITNEMSANDLLKLIQELSPQYRTVFNLYAIEGYSHKEISKKLSIKEGTSKSNLSRAREILKEKIKINYKVSVGYI